MHPEKTRTKPNPRCDNCSFSIYATGPGRTVLICRQKKGSEGRWKTRPLLQNCQNFHPSRAAYPKSQAPRLIPLTRGKFAVVDPEDYPNLSQFTWFAEGGPKTYYAVRKQNGKSIKMHRQITNAPDHLVVDHIDHNGLNNQRSNLRLATFTQNCQNQRRSSHKTSKYKGVHWHRAKKKMGRTNNRKQKNTPPRILQKRNTSSKSIRQSRKKTTRPICSAEFPRFSTRTPPNARKSPILHLIDSITIATILLME